MCINNKRYLSFSTICLSKPFIYKLLMTDKDYRLYKANKNSNFQFLCKIKVTCKIPQWPTYG